MKAVMYYDPFIPAEWIAAHDRYVWCDKWSAALVWLKELITLPVFDLDTGDSDKNSQSRLATRIQAFLELLR